MDSNTYSTPPPDAPPEPTEDLAELAAAVNTLAAQDAPGLPDSVRAARLVAWRRLLDRQEGLWLGELAALDARGAVGELDQPAPSTASWLRSRLRMSASAAHSTVRTSRALFRGALPETAAALVGGEISPAHARVVADGTTDLPEHLKLDADPVLVEAAGRLDPSQLRRLAAHLVQVADPEGAEKVAERRHERRGVWLSPTWDNMVAVDGLLDAEAGSVVQAALEPLARPTDAGDARKGSQRTADALTELARRSLEGGWLPRAGGVRPQLLVTVDLDTLLGHPGGLGGDTGWVGPLPPEACRRLACDGAVTRVVVSRQTTQDHRPGGGSGDLGEGVASGDQDPSSHGAAGRGLDPGPDEPVGLPERLGAAMTLLPPTLGGAPCRPLDVGRATRVVTPAQRSALAVRDRGCVFPACDRPLAWCDAHHLVFWLDGGPTDLANLALLCRAHHRTVHEGGWQLTRGPDGRFRATPPQPRHRGAT